MTSKTSNPNFDILLSHGSDQRLLEQLIKINDVESHNKYDYKNWDTINKYPIHDFSEDIATDWLIILFNHLFAHHQVTLVRGEHEPEYFPACDMHPARIQFAHGFFSSALHEISHWCIASIKRRKLIDFGYWYAPDGRSAEQQQQFERLEIKPQALECLFTLACKRPFQVSQDNLFADFETQLSTFATDVYQQAAHYIDQPQQLPGDAKILLQALLMANVID